MKSPRVTIGIPTYGRADLLCESIDSLLNQSFQDFRILVADNGTPGEEKRRLAEKYYDTRIQFHFHPTNLGPIKNFLYLRDLAQSEYFMWLGDDDTLAPNFLEETVTFLEKNPNHVLATGIPWFVTDTTKEQLTLMNLEDPDAQQRYKEYLRTVTHNSIYYGLMRTKSAQALHYGTHIGGDWLWVAQLAYTGKLRTLTDTAVYRRVSEGNNQTYARMMNLSSLQGRLPTEFVVSYYLYQHVFTHPLFQGMGTLKQQKFILECINTLLKRHTLSSYIGFALHETTPKSVFQFLRKLKHMKNPPQT